MATWSDPPEFGCAVAADNRHDWGWVWAEAARGSWAWFAGKVMRCTNCGRAPSDPWAQPNPAEAFGGAQ